jgi:putative ABC transport system permease protein
VWQAWHTDIRHGLRTAVAAASGAVQHRLRSAFVVVELSLAIVLLVAAGLLVRSFQEIRSADPGYDPNGALAMRLALSDDRYPTPASMRAFYERLHDEARQLPGVAGVSAANELPTTDDYHAASLWTSDDPSMRSEDRPVVLYESVMPDYFEVMGTPLLEGRAFAPADSEHAPLVAIVDRSTALKNWPGESPIGRRLKVGRGQPWREVVGVVADMEQGVLVKLLKGRLGQVYLPFAQEPKAAMSLVVRANVVPATLVPALRDLVRKADVDQPLFQVETMVDARAAGRAAHRLATTLVAAFAAAALLLATLGIYGVVANGVGERTREFGIRLSLGARPSDVLGLVLRHAIALMGIGTIVGLLAAAALTRAVSTLLVGVRTTDPATFGGVVLLLAAVGVLASYVPARRATRVDPATTLRCE